MSACAVAYIDDLRIPIRGRHVVMRDLAALMDAITGKLVPRISTLARRNRLSKRTVLYHLRWAVDAGILERKRRAKGRSNTYVLHVGRTPLVPVDAPCVTDSQAPDCTSDCTSEPPEPAQIAPQIAPQEKEEGEERKEEEEEKGTRASAREAAAPPPGPPPSGEILEVGKEGRRIEVEQTAPAVPKPPRRSRWGETIAPTWWITEDHRQFLTDHGISGADSLAERFLLKHLASGWRSPDWDSAFLSWCLEGDGRAGKRDRRQEHEDWIASEKAALQAYVPEGCTIVGVAA